MKKYINSVSFFFLIFILFPSLVSAVSSSYYQKIFDEWGIKADIYQGETKVGLEGFLKAGENKERQSVDSNNTKPNVSRLVLLSSQLEGGFNVSDYSDKYTEFYIVCDVEMVMESNSCSGLGFENENQVVNTEDAKILVTENNKKKLNLIPQNYFVIPSTRKDLGIYFKASQVSFEQQKQGDIPNKPGILSKTPLLLLGLSQYALYIFIIITFTYGVLIHSRNKTTLTCFIKRIYSDHRILYFRLKSYRGMLLYAAMFLFFILILIIYVITLKDNGSFSFEGMSSVFNSIIKLNKEKTLSQTILLLSFMLFLLLFVTYLMFDFVSILSISISKIVGNKVKLVYIEWGIPLFTYLLIMLSVFQFFNFSFVCSVLILFYLLYAAQRRGLSFKFSKKQLILILVGFITSVPLSLYLQTRHISDFKYVYEDLIGIDVDVVKLPYYKVSEKNELFKPFRVSYEFPVFVNNYAVYFPKYKTIVNSPLSTYSNISDFFIVADFRGEEFLHIFMTSEDLQDLFKSDSGDLIKFSPVSNESNYYWVVTLDCQSDVPENKITYELLSLGTDTESRDLMYFPGCSAGEADVTFNIPVDRDFYEDSYLLIRSKYSDSIKYVGIQGSLNLQNVSHFDLPSEGFFKGYLGSDTITFYSPAIKERIEFQSDSSVIDLSSRINSLKQGGLIGNDFEIWSPNVGAYFTLN